MRGFVKDRLEGLRVRIPPRTGLFLSFECCVLSQRGIGFSMITLLVEPY
jgi:hypothetical protein